MDLLDYRPYLDHEFRDEFDAWASSFKDPWSELDLELAQDDPNLHLGPASFLSPYNWESDRRLEHMNGQGIAAEIVFPNTVPPFYPSGFVTAGAPSTPEEYRLRWAGVKAHNRWLAEFCAEAPGRRGGLAQVFLNDIEDAIAEVRWAKKKRLAGIVIPPDHITKLVNLYERHLDPFWAACCELGCRSTGTRSRSTRQNLPTPGRPPRRSGHTNASCSSIAAWATWCWEGCSSGSLT